MPQFVITSTAGPTQISSTVKNFRRATLLGKKAVAGTANTGNVKLGRSSASNEQPFLIEPDDEITLQAAPGQRLDFSQWWFTVASSGDGLVVMYD